MPTGGMRPHPEALYYHIAKSASEKARLERDEFKRQQLVATALVFSALCLEAYINQELTKTKVGDEEQISLEAKWLWLPLLLGNQLTFDRSKEPYQTFKKLVTLRNQRLVHFKPSTEIQTTEKQYSKRYFSDIIGDAKLAEKCVRCVEEMIHELNRLTNNATDIPKFLNGEKYTSEVWSESAVPYESL
jgi:hypothetical protein